MSELDENLRHNKGFYVQRWHPASTSRRGEKECFGARSWHQRFVYAALAVASFSLLGALPQSAIAAQPSFDCAKARSWSEIEVCRDDALAGLDATLASLYRTQKARLDQRRHNALIIDQRQWLAERDNCRFTPSGSRCLTEIYKRRIAELSSSPGLDAGSNSPTAGVPPGQASAPTAETASSARGEDRVRAGTARATHNAEQEEADRRNAAAMADWWRLLGAPMRNRLAYVSGEYGSLAIQAAHLTVMQSLAGKCSTVLRVKMVNGEDGEADWPMLLRLRHRGTIHEKGWFLVSGELLPDSDPQKRDGLPIPTLDISEAFRCETEACSSQNDLIAMIRMHAGLADWLPDEVGNRR